MRYGLELQKRLQGILNDIYYRIHSYNVIVSGSASIAGKITVQVDARRDARSFWWGGSVGSVLTKPINLHCSVDVLVASADAAS